MVQVSLASAGFDQNLGRIRCSARKLLLLVAFLLALTATPKGPCGSGGAADALSVRVPVTTAVGKNSRSKDERSLRGGASSPSFVPTRQHQAQLALSLLGERSEEGRSGAAASSTSGARLLEKRSDSTKKWPSFSGAGQQEAGKNTDDNLWQGMVPFGAPSAPLRAAAEVAARAKAQGAATAQAQAAALGDPEAAGAGTNSEEDSAASPGAGPPGPPEGASSFPMPTCGGTQDMKGTVQMEQTHGRPCKFPFYYEDEWYYECTTKDNDGVPWCRVEFPPKGEEGPIRWALCNPDRKPCPETPANLGQDQANAAAAEKVADATQKLEHFFSYNYWRPLFFCSAALLLFSEVIGPAVDVCTGKSFLGKATVFFCQMFSFLLVGAIYSDPSAAAAQHILALSFVMVSIGLLLLLAALLLRMRRACSKEGSYSDGLGIVANDISDVLPGVSRAVIVVLLVYGILDDVGVEWTGVAAVAAVVSLGITLATTGIASDFLAYVFIRLGGWFREGDVIYIAGEAVSVTGITWRYTEVYRGSTRSPLYVPNKDVGFAQVNNQSRDNGRCVFKTIPLEPSLSAAQLESIVKEMWQLLYAFGGDKSFVALNGEKYESQLDVDGSAVYLSDRPAAQSAKELSQMTITLKLAGKYWYSNPPPWTDKEKPEPKKEDRQYDWCAPWNYQVEYVLLEVQKILEVHGALGR